MGLRKKRQPAHVPSYEIQQHHAEPGGHLLPGIAGYSKAEPLPKGGMPISRFNYVRPDGRPDQ
jgi:hypothetical protein